MGKDIYDVAENMIRNNPNFKNNPKAQQILQIIHNRDDKAGVELANQFLQDNGMTREAGIQQAMRLFGFNNN